MNAVTKVKKDSGQQMTAQDENQSLISMIGRLASDPNVDVEKMERLMQMRERAIEREAKAQYDEAIKRIDEALKTKEQEIMQV